MSEPEDPYRAPDAELIDESAERGGSIEGTLAGGADLDLSTVMREAWERIDGIKGIVLAGWLAALVLSLVGGAVLSIVLSAGLSQFVITIALYPVFAGIFMVALRRSVDLPVDYAEPFNYFDRIVPIAAAGVLASVATTIGLFLLVLPGIYLAIALSLSIPLVVDKNMPVIDALLTSLKLINTEFLTVLLLVLVSGLVVAAAALTVVGLIWALPWAVMVYAITYRQLAGASVNR